MGIPVMLGWQKSRRGENLACPMLPVRFKRARGVLLLCLFCCIAAVPRNARGETDSARVARLFMWASEGTDRYRDKVDPAKDSLGQMGAKAAVWLAKKLITSDARERLSLADAFEKIGKPATPYIVPYLEAEGEDAPRNAARCLERIKDTAAVIPLLAQMDHPEYSVRSQVASALGKTGDARARDSLLNHLEHDADSDVRKSCAVALGDIGGGESGTALLRALNDPFFGVRQSAMRSLARFDSTFFRHEHKPAAIEDTSVSEVMTHGLMVASGMSGRPEARQRLVELLGSQDPMLRGFAVEGLALGDPRQSTQHIEKLKQYEDDPFVLAQIARFEQLLLAKRHEQSKSK